MYFSSGKDKANIICFTLNTLCNSVRYPVELCGTKKKTKIEQILRNFLCLYYKLVLFTKLSAMESQETVDANFDHRESLRVISEMIEVSRKKLRHDGILFIIWGWALFYSSFIRYLKEEILFSNFQYLVFRYVEAFLLLFVFGVTLWYLFRKRRRAATYIGISLRWVWFSTVFCMVLINLIQGNVVHKINFELQHPIFMVVIAFGVVVSGVMLRYGFMIGMGILFGILAYVSSFFELHEQMLVESIAWFLAFILPGHILFAKKSKEG